jgi:hypothetical protein
MHLASMRLVSVVQLVQMLLVLMEHINKIELNTEIPC